MGKVRELLEEIFATAEDHYGPMQYERNLAEAEARMPEAVAADAGNFVWRISWTRDGSTVSTLFGSNNTEAEMVKACQIIAASPWKLPVTLEAVVERRVWP